MSVPSEYDLTQDALIAPMRDILLTAAEPPSGPEFSYPVVDQAMNSEMWRWVNRGVGDGIIDDGGRPYWLTSLNNATNTAVVQVSTTRGTANALVGGFFHQLNSNKTVSLPMPSSGTVTYRVALTYDQTRESAAEGPVTLQVYSGELPTGARYKHSVLWEVVRSANQLLTDATVRRLTVRTAPTVLVWEKEQLPDAESVAWGTLAYVHRYGEWWIARGATDDAPAATRWENASAIDWHTYAGDGNTEFYTYPGHGARVSYGKSNGIVYIEGRMARRSGSNFLRSNPDGYNILSLPAGYRPPQARRFVTSGSGLATPTYVTVNISTNGEVRAYPSRDTPWMTLEGIWFREAGS